ncbi:MAG TPA: hypothetical protein VHR86_05855 [Armatimonadota bacterium]|nr:hypothetical protein [Armatimonadota bacterium]
MASKGGKSAGIQIAGTKIKAYHSDGSAKVKAYHSDDSTSSNTSVSASDFDSDSDRIYDSDTTPTSAGSDRTGRRKPSYHRERRSRSRNRSEDFVVIERPRRRTSTTYAPDPPRAGGSRVHTYNRVGPSPSPSVVSGPSQQLQTGFEEMVALGVAALTRAAAGGLPAQMQPQMGYATPAPRVLTNMERGAHEDLRVREEQRRVEAEERMQQDKVQEAVQEAVREEMARREEVAREVARREARMEAAVNEAAAARERESDRRDRGREREREREAFGPAPRRFADDELLDRYRARDREMFASAASGSMARERKPEWPPRRRGEYAFARGVPRDDEKDFEYVRDPNPFRPLPTRERRGGYRY